MSRSPSPADVQNEIRRVLAYSKSGCPSRAKIASQLRGLASGLVGTTKVAAAKNWGALALQWMANLEEDLAETIRISKGFKTTRDDGTHSYEGRGWTRLLIGETSQGTANAKTIVFWDDGRVVVHVNYHVGFDLTALFGRSGRDVDFDDNPNVVLSKVRTFFNEL